MWPVAYEPGSDLYSILGVSPDTPDAEIGRAFRRLARRYHPDSTSGQEQRFRDVKQAYETLGDPRRRADYDALRGGGPGQGVRIPVNRDSPRREAPPAPSEVDLPLSFADAVLGATVRVEVPAAAECPGCVATGEAPAARCQRCGGDGRTVHMTGQFTLKRICDDCSGTGLRPAGQCAQCAGRGWLVGARSVAVRIPAGIADGARLRLPPGPAGGTEVFARVAVRPHRWFVRRHADLVIDVPLSVAEAMLGTRLQVPTIEGGRAWLDVPPASSPGTEIRLGGRGVPGTPPGDLVAAVRVVFPDTIAGDLEAALGVLAAACPPPRREWEDPEP